MNDYSPKTGSTSDTTWERATLEKLVLAQVNEARASRRWRMVKTLLWLLLFAAFVYALFMGNPEKTKVAGLSEPHTALINIYGEIGADAEASSENLLPSLRKAFESSGAQAVVLHIDSPGGSPVQAGLINDEVKRLKAKYNKKVIVVVGEMCASAAYYIAASADEIYVDKASIVGSIGVLMDGFGFTGTMEKLGIERRLMTAGSNKGMLDPFSPLKPEDAVHVQTMLEQIHQQFIAVVKAGRGKRLQETPDTFSGKFWTGEESIRLGLADHLGGVDYVAREVVKAEEIVDYTPNQNVAERLAKKFGASVGAGAYKAAMEHGLAVR